MVCAYQRILFDRQPLLGEHDLDVVLTHPQKLDAYLSLKIGKSMARPLVSTKGGTIQRG